jgi:putative ATP-dependent endonuclease of OLD family
VDELARREAEVIVELLRSEQERRRGHRNLADVRALAARLLDGLVSHELIQSVETRVSDYLVSLTGGVSRQHAFIGRQEVDDAFLARVLELLLASVDQRSLTQRLEVSGLGYVNLLHMAVTLAAIPRGRGYPRSTSRPRGERWYRDSCAR